MGQPLNFLLPAPSRGSKRRRFGKTVVRLVGLDATGQVVLRKRETTTSAACKTMRAIGRNAPLAVATPTFIQEQQLQPVQ